VSELKSVAYKIFKRAAGVFNVYYIQFLNKEHFQTDLSKERSLMK